MGDRSVAELVRSAAEGDRAAWDTLIERYAALVWNVARGHRLSTADAADVSQTVWLRLVENLTRLRQPEALAGWLATTARNESLRTLRRGGREMPDEDVDGAALNRPADEPGPETQVLRGERRGQVWHALGTLSPRCQLLLRALANTPEASYAEVSAALGMPVGSIGPTRSRCLNHLRKALTSLGLATAGD